MPFNPIGRFISSGGTTRKNDFRRPVTFFDRVRFVGPDSTMEIFGGSLNGSDITTGTISVDRLVVGTGGSNLISDPGFESGNSTSNSVHSFNDGGAEWSIGTIAERSGDYGVRYNPSGQTSDATITCDTNHFVCQDGDVFEISMWHRYAAGSTTNDSFVQTLWYDSADTFLSAVTDVATPTNSWAQIQKEHTAPTLASYGVARFGVQNDGGDRIQYIDDLVVTRQVGTFGIQAGAITADKLTVTSLDAITATMGTLTVNETLTMDTGAVLRTAVSGERVELSFADRNALTLYSGDDDEATTSLLAFDRIGTQQQTTAYLRTFLTSGSLNVVGNDVIMTLQSVSRDDSSVDARWQVQTRNAGDMGGVVQTMVFAHGNLYVPFGTELLPSYAFGLDTDVGMYRVDTNQMGFSTGGVNRFTIADSVATFNTDVDLNGNEIIDSPTAVRRRSKTLHNVTSVAANSEKTLVVDISSTGFTSTSNMYVTIIGSADNQFSFKSVYAYSVLSTTSITIKINGMSQITGSGTAFFQLQIIEYY